MFLKRLLAWLTIDVHSLQIGKFAPSVSTQLIQLLVLFVVRESAQRAPKARSA